MGVGAECETASESRMRAGLFVVVEADDARRRALLASAPRAWFYVAADDADAVRRAVDRYAVAGVIVSERAADSATIVSEIASLGVPVVVLAESDANAWRERGAVAVLPHPARVPDSAVALAGRLEEMALASWLEGGAR